MTEVHNGEAPCHLKLHMLPDDILLRIIQHVGDMSRQIGVAYRLAAVSHRLHHLVHTQFLPTLTNLSENSLSALSLSNAMASRVALEAFFSSTTGIRNLNLSGCSPSLLSTRCMTTLANSVRYTLTTVKLAYCRISDEAIHPLLQCTALHTVNLISCDGPTGKIFHRATCQAPIRNLDLSWVPSVTHDGVLAIATLSTVTHLVLNGCDKVCSNILHLFATSEIRHSLCSLSLSYCPERDETLFARLKRAPNVASLTLAEYTGNLWEMGEYTREGIEQLRNLYPLIDIRFRICG